MRFLQTSRIEAIHRVRVSRRGKVPVPGEELMRRFGQPRRYGLAPEFRVGLQESIDYGFVLFRFCRTRTIDQHPAGPQARSHRFENLELCRVMTAERFRILSPLRFRMPPQHPKAAARSIDENAIHRAIRWSVRPR